MDFNTPAISQNYATGYTAAITANQVDLGKLLDSSSVTVSNPVAGVKRYNATNDLFEQRNAGNTAWEEMPLAYLKLSGGTLTGALVGTSGNFTSALQLNGSNVWHAGNFNPATKQDALGYTPVNKAGDTMTGTHNFATLQVGGQGVWHAGNFNPANYAALSGASFTGNVNSTLSFRSSRGWDGTNGSFDLLSGTYVKWSTTFGSTTTNDVLFGAASGVTYWWRWTGSAWTNTMNLDGAGNLTAAGNITASSDAALKTDLRPFEPDLAALAAVPLYDYLRIDSKQRQFGVLAQDLQRVLPMAVHAGKDGLSVDYGRAALAAVIALAKKVCA